MDSRGQLLLSSYHQIVQNNGVSIEADVQIKYQIVDGVGLPENVTVTVKQPTIDFRALALSFGGCEVMTK